MENTRLKLTMIEAFRLTPDIYDKLEEMLEEDYIFKSKSQLIRAAIIKFYRGWKYDR